MGAPTWPPTPEEALKQTRKEYGQTEGQFLSPEAYESDWLQTILAKPTFQIQNKGPNLEEHLDFLKYWMGLNGLKMRPIQPTEGHAAQDFESYFLPRKLGVSVSDSRLSWRIMLIIQSKIRQLGIHRNKPLLKELHEDWGLRQHLLLLIGILCHAQIRPLWAQMSTTHKVSQLYLGQTEIKQQDLPPEIVGYVFFALETPKHPQLSVIQTAIAKILSSPEIMKLASLQSEALHIKSWFRSRRYGIPPNPFVLGSIRPSWIDNALKVNRAAVDAWKAGPKPLRLLNKVLGRKKKNLVLTDLAPQVQPQRSIMTLDEWSGEDWNKNLVEYTETSAAPTDNTRYLQIIEHHRQEAEALKDSLFSLCSEKKRRFQSTKGDELDIDAFVRSRTQLQLNMSPKENWFIEVIEAQRIPKITVLIDSTGSAHYRFQQAQQEALALLTYASIGLPIEWEVWSFEGISAGKLEFKCFKSFSASPMTVQTRLDSLGANGGSRLGAVLRWQAHRNPSSNQLVLWFSDLIPEDGKSYALEYAERDLWMAIQELNAHQQLHCFDFAGRVDIEKAQRLLGKKHYTQPKQIERFPALFSAVLLMYLAD